MTFLFLQNLFKIPEIKRSFHELEEAQAQAQGVGQGQGPQGQHGMAKILREFQERFQSSPLQQIIQDTAQLYR
jgi:hypothetical protein